jgi:hypothetical protein
MRWLSLLLLLGCSESIGPYELRSGSRLELRYWHYEDGTRQWDSGVYFDRVLEKECALHQRSYGPTFCEPTDGEQLPEAELVRVFRHTPIGDGRVQVSMLTTEDGMQAPGRLYDARVESDCRITPFADGTVRCLPTKSEIASYFADAACTTPRLAVLGTVPVPPAASITDDVTYCPTYLRVEREVSKYPLYQRQGDACVEIELPDHMLVYELGERVEPVLSTRMQMDGARLERVELVDGSMHVPVDWLFDPALVDNCERVRFDGFSLCIPKRHYSLRKTYYFDASCQGSFQNGITVQERACEATPTLYGYTTSKLFKVFELATPSGPLFEIGSNGCMPVDSASIRMIGRELPLGTFLPAVPE